MTLSLICRRFCITEARWSCGKDRRTKHPPPQKERFCIFAWIDHQRCSPGWDPVGRPSKQGIPTRVIRFRRISISASIRRTLWLPDCCRNWLCRARGSRARWLLWMMGKFRYYSRWVVFWVGESITHCSVVPTEKLGKLVICGFFQFSGFNVHQRGSTWRTRFGQGQWACGRGSSIWSKSRTRKRMCFHYSAWKWP